MAEAPDAHQGSTPAKPGEGEIDGYVPIEQAPSVWGRYRNWWYKQVREGGLTGYDVPGHRGTYLSRSEVEQFIKPKPKTKPASSSQDAQGSPPRAARKRGGTTDDTE